MKDAIILQVINHANLLVACAEPIKALNVLNSAPVFVENDERIINMKVRLKDATAHAACDHTYTTRYSSYANGMCGITPFCDTGLLQLPRAQFTIQTAKDLQPNKILAIGGGEGSIERELLKVTEATIYFSELQEGQNNVIDALNDEFPFSAAPFGRMDLQLDVTPNEQFDMVECLEVVEHVKDPQILIDNIHSVLKPGGVLVMTTPNAEDWVEYKLIEELQDPTKWFHHITAFTVESLQRHFSLDLWDSEIYYGGRTLLVKAVKK